MSALLATDETQMRSGLAVRLIRAVRVERGVHAEESCERSERHRRAECFQCRQPLSGVNAALLLLLLLLASARFASATPSLEFEAANKLFEQGKFADAAAGYERLLTNGPTVALHFNLGNARFKSGQPGIAIFHFHQALRLAPRDPDALGNLQFARRSLGVTMEESFGQHMLRRNTLDEWAWLAGAAVGAWFLLLGLGEALPSKRAAFGGLTRGVGVLAVMLAALLGAAHWDRSSARSAVVILREAPARPGPLAESKVAFALRDGAEVTVLDSKDGWLHVRDTGQRAGWVKRDAVRLLP